MNLSKVQNDIIITWTLNVHILMWLHCQRVGVRLLFKDIFLLKIIFR